MLQTLLLIGLMPFLVAFILNIPSFWRAFSGVKGWLFWFCIAWAAMFIGQGQMFSHRGYTAGTNDFGAGIYYQLGWMAFAGLVLWVVAFGSKFDLRTIKFPMVMLAVYATLGAATSGFSPAPMFSFYKASQVFLDFMLLVLGGSILLNSERPCLVFNLTVFLLSLVLMSAAACGVFLPDLAFKELYGRGAFGHTLNSVFPQVHSNELGLLSAALIVVSLRRWAEKKQSGLRRFYWLSLCLLSSMVLIGAQARTSIFSLSLSLIVMTFLIPRLRWMSAILVTGAVVVGFFYMISGSQLGVENDLANYLRRGSTNEQLQTMSGRTGLWKAGWHMFQASPMIGHGFQAGARMAGARFGISPGTNMHNGHMEVLVDSGLLGYIAWIMFVVPTIWTTFMVLIRKYLPIKKETGRFHLEVSLVMFIIFFRTFLGQILVTHQISTLLFLGAYLYVVTYRVTSDLHTNDDVSINDY